MRPANPDCASHHLALGAHGGARHDSLGHTDSAPDPGVSPAATLEGALELARVLGAGSATLRRALASLAEGDIDFAALQAAFDDTQAQMIAQELALLGHAAAPELGSDEAGIGLAVDELERLVTAHAADAHAQRDDVEEWGPGGTQREEAAIALQMLVQSTADAALTVAELRLQGIRRRELEHAALCRDEVPDSALAAVIVEAVIDLAESLPIPAFDSVFAFLAPTFRRVVCPLLENLPPIVDRMSEHGREALWPHAADELLAYLKRRRTGLDPRLEALSSAARERALQRLVALPTLRNGRLDPTSFALEQSFAHGLFLELLQMPAVSKVVGPVVLAALKGAPPQEAWLANVIRATPEYSPHIDPFLRWALIARSGKSVDLRLVHLAADELVVRIEALPAGKRDVSWLPGAIEWIGVYGSLRGFDLLERVQNERRLLRHEWSKECREAARLGIERGWEGRC